MNAYTKYRKLNGVEYIVQCPSGARVLREIGHGFAHLRPAFGPARPEIASERLNFSTAFDRVHVAPDGTFINAKHLWSILIGIVKPGFSRPLSEFNEVLFFDKPNLHNTLMKLFAAYNPDDSYWQGMVAHGYYDPASRTVHRHSAA